MENYDPVYYTDNSYCSDNSIDSEDSLCRRDNSNQKTGKNLNTKYLEKTYNFIIDTNDRNWFTTINKINGNSIIGQEIKTFEFKIRFGNDGDSYEYNKDKKLEFFSSQYLSFPINLKNIISFQIQTLVIPNRLIYLGNGSYTNILNFRYLTVHTNELSNTYYGTNKVLNNTIGILYPLSIVYPNDNVKHIEFREKGNMIKNFNPVPLSTINCLNISIKDPQGNTLRFKNDILNIKKIEIIKDNNFIKITTKEWFNGEYQDGDIIKIKNFKFSDNSLAGISGKLKNFINRTQGHRIYLNTNFSNNKLGVVENLKNEFSILTEGDYIEDKFTIFNYINSNIDKASSGEILNTNLQLSFLMKLKTKIYEFHMLDTQII